jgi:predicted phosphate transport protein (TIGR00153 family)
MEFSLIPKEIQFFDLFDKQSAVIKNAAKCFKDLAISGTFDDAGIERMKDIEHQCDEITHDIIDKLNRCFITPFDREDIYELAHELDDLVDMLYSVSKRMRLYKVSGVRPEMVKFAELIEQSANCLGKALNGLRNSKHHKPILVCCIEINRLENEGDHLRDHVIGELFEKEKDVMTVIKLKEIFEGVETCLDIIEDTGNIIESILVKNA